MDSALTDFFALSFTQDYLITQDYQIVLCERQQAQFQKNLVKLGEYLLPGIEPWASVKNAQLDQAS